MTVAIIGAGNVGQALARALLDKGERIRFGVPDPAKHATLPARHTGDVTVGTVNEAIAAPRQSKVGALGVLK